MKLFCQTFSKTAPTPPEKPLHLRSQSRSCFWKSRSPAKRGLSLALVLTRTNKAAANRTAHRMASGYLGYLQNDLDFTLVSPPFQAILSPERGSAQVRAQRCSHKI